jgi:hypothetical protein
MVMGMMFIRFCHKSISKVSHFNACPCSKERHLQAKRKEKGMTAINKVNGYRSVARSKTIDVMKPGQRPVPSHGIWPRAQKRIEFLIEKIGQTK